MPEIAFASYANEDGKYDSYLWEFIRDLRKEVRLLNPKGTTSPADCVFFDAASIETGQDWMDRISKSVKGCKVLIAFCSPLFHSSQFCGKEVHVFLSRLKVWQAANTNSLSRCIISVLWKHSATSPAIPSALTNYQFVKHPKDEDGNPITLRVLCKINKYKDEREQFIEDLATAVEEAWSQDLTPMEAIPHFDHIPNAFEDIQVPAPFGIAAVNLLNGSTNPIAFDQLLGQVCGSTQLFRTLNVGEGFAEALAAAQKTKEAILIVADPTTLANPPVANVFDVLDALRGEQAGLVIFDDKPIDARLLQGRFPKSHKDFWEVRFETSGETGRMQALSEVIAKLKAKLIAETPAVAAHNIQIIDQAKAEGVPIERKPIIIGPESPR